MENFLDPSIRIFSLSNKIKKSLRKAGKHVILNSAIHLTTDNTDTTDGRIYEN